MSTVDHNRTMEEAARDFAAVEDMHNCDHDMPAIMERAMRLLGDKWTLMIVYNLMSGQKRFGELLDALGNISPKTLSQRLKQLEEIKLLERHAFAEIPPRVEYLLTEKGYQLVTILKAIQEFGVHCLSDLPVISL